MSSCQCPSDLSVQLMHYIMLRSCVCIYASGGDAKEALSEVRK